MTTHEVIDYLGQGPGLEGERVGAGGGAGSSKQAHGDGHGPHDKGPGGLAPPANGESVARATIDRYRVRKRRRKCQPHREKGTSTTMDLTNSFTVPADIDTAWDTLLDVEAIAPCMPGAKLTNVDGDEFTGTVKVKLGPVSLTYGGEAMFLEKDAANHVAIIEGTGKETRGSGTAKATVTTALVAESAEVTRVDVTTNLTITGKAAQFGRGVMQDVAGRLVDQFAANLEGVIASRMPATAEPADASADSPEASSPAAPTPAPAPQAEALDLGAVAAGPVLKRVVPVVIGVVAVVAIVWLVTRNR